ncbi:MAG: UDP-N-acetylmuramoyl-tripeptide--D-alanyl-D-alanine ligase [Pseudomonadota bacterium]
MMLLSEAAQVLNARLLGADVRFSAVSTDTRTIAAGDLFVALKGENFDGAQFVGAAGMSGAVAAVVNADSYHGGESPCPLLLVDDTRLALGQLAAYWRNRFAIPVLAVTGSNGKTSVKEMLAAILRAHTGAADSVLATQGNLNNDIGMPLTLLKLRAGHRYAVIEMGMNHPGEIDYLTRLARPGAALINNASGAHLQGLGSVEAVARAKGEIFAGLDENGTAIINADDAYAPLWRELAGNRRILDFGLTQPAAVQGDWQAQGYGGVLHLRTPQGEANIVLQVPGEHNARNALAAASAALAAGVPLSAIERGLSGFAGVYGRLQRKPARNGAVLIDDTYNANPASLRAAMQVLARAEGKRILVLGDMGELGEDAPLLHEETGAEAKRLGLDGLYALGNLTQYTARAYGAGAKHFDAMEDLLAALEAELAPGVTVLVKGSRFMRMERVVQHCAAQEKE